jgi:phage terminase small subunit
LKTLTPRQQRFADEYIVCGNGSEAARRAGYSERTARQIAAENLSKPDIKAAIEAARAREAEYWRLQKREVIAALLGTIKMAKEQANPAAMIRGLVEIAKMLGYYAPEVVKVPLSEDAERLRQRYEAMSDEELYTAMAAGGAKAG